MSDNINYKQNNVDIGKCFVTRDYFNNVYTSVNTSYKRNALWAWGYMPLDLSPGGSATHLNDPYMVQPQSCYSFHPSGWKDFHISSSCSGEINVRLLDQQGKMYVWGGLAGLGVSYVGTSGVFGYTRPSALCTTAIIESCTVYNCIQKLGRDHSDCHVSYNTNLTHRIWGYTAGGMIGNASTLGSGGLTYQWLPRSVASGFSCAVNYISLQNYSCSGIYSSHALNGRSPYYWGCRATPAYSEPVQISGISFKTLCSSGATVGGTRTDGTDTLVIMGYNNKGQLGNSTTIGCIGYLSGCFSNTNPSLSVKSYSLGICSSFAVASNGTLWAWGDNSSGQLGNNKTVNTSCPVQSIDTNNDWKYVTSNRMGTAVAALKNDGSLWVWGDVCYVQQAGVGECIRRSSPVQVGTKKNWVKIAIESDRSDTQVSTNFMIGITEEDL
jgi:hypothetical protein